MRARVFTRKHCNVFHGYYYIFLRPITWRNAYLSSFFVSTASPLSSELRTFVIFLNLFSLFHSQHDNMATRNY